MNKKQLKPIIASSADGAKISATITGIIISCASLIVAFSASKGVAITDAQVVSAAGQIGGAVGGIVTLYGLIRKIIIAFGSVKTEV